MTKEEWIKIVEENREKLTQKLEEAWKKVIGSDWDQKVEINQDGKVSSYSASSNGNEVTGEVWNGKAIEVARIKAEGEVTHIELDDEDDDSIPEEEKYTLEDYREEMWEEYGEHEIEVLLNDFIDDLKQGK